MWDQLNNKIKNDDELWGWQKSSLEKVQVIQVQPGPHFTQDGFRLWCVSVSISVCLKTTVSSGTLP